MCPSIGTTVYLNADIMALKEKEDPMNSIAGKSIGFFFNNRAADISVIERTVQSLFGSPNFIRANGISEVGLIANAANAIRSLCSKEKKIVFQIDRKGTFFNEALPRIWLFEESVEAKGERGNSCRAAVCYPNGKDKGGVQALKLAEGCFSNGMKIYGTDKAVEYFQASEILYLHAASRGSLAALTRLGVLYEFDMCSGKYWKPALNRHAKHAEERINDRAIRMFKRASARGSAEAKRHLGDMLKHISIENHALSFNLYKGSFVRACGCKLSDIENISSVECVMDLIGERSNLMDAGCAALRLAECEEFGMGCRRNISKAELWYRCAVLLLDSSVSSGLWYYGEELERAERGSARVLAD